VLDRRGFDGLEREKRISDNNYYTHFREQDAEIGRWWGVDPKFKEHESPYSSMGNNPVSRTDIMGDIDGDDKDKLLTERKPEARSTTAMPSQIIPPIVPGSQPASGGSTPNEGKGTSKTLESGAALAGFVDQMYDLSKTGEKAPNLTVVKSPGANGGLNVGEGVGVGLNLLSTTLGTAQLYDQYKNEGTVNPIDATAVGLGTVGTVANGLSLAGYGGVGVATVAKATGMLGLGITAGQMWYGIIYKPIFQMQKFNTPTTNSIDEQNAGQVLQNCPSGF
jgi:hypothetical protein